MNVDPTPFQTTMIEERKDPSGVVKPIVSDSFLSFLNDVRDAGNVAFAQVGNGIMGPAYRNPIVDGGFEVWDGSRALTLAAATGYTGCTMWSYSAGAGFAGYTVSRQAGLVPGSQWCLRYQRTAAGANVLQQSLLFDMESILSIPYAGQEITLSFTARAGANFSAASGILSSTIQTGTGTDQAQRTALYTGSILTTQANTLATTAQRFTMSITVPANATQIGLNFWFIPVGVAGAADYFEIDDVQLETSTYATVFERLPWDMVRNRVMRYYFKTFLYDVVPAAGAGVGGSYVFYTYVGPGIAQGMTEALPVRMRTSGVCTSYNPNVAANAQIRDNSLALNWTGSGATSNEHLYLVAGFTPVGSALGDVNQVHVTVDARI